MIFDATRLNRGDRSSPRGFTLIEVLVVVAVIVLLVAILLPSLSQARERSRATVCLSQLKEMGRALQMYGVDYRDSLPGPLHPGVLKETYNMFFASDYDGYHLPYFLRRYFSERTHSQGKFTDSMVSCPTAVALSPSGLKATSVASSGYFPFSYSLNNNKKNFRGAPYGTDPAWYFGYPDAYWLDGPAPFAAKSPPTSPIDLADYRDGLPKKIFVVRQPAREWEIGDAFAYEQPLPLSALPGKKPGQWQIGTYQYGGFPLAVSLPTKPYHSNGINQLCFDGHAEWQRPWRGTTNDK
jgi:prepilin-type N-terminal cleavage/methylation domain-containing protein